MAAPNIRGSLVRRPEQRGPEGRVPRVQGVCDLHVCEPLIATLFTLVLLLTYGPVLPAPFGPALPPVDVAATGHQPTGGLVASATPTSERTREARVPAATPTATTFQPTRTAVTPRPTDTLSPLATETPVSTATAVPSMTETSTLTPVADITPTPTEVLTPAPQSPDWDLARDIIGLWEYVGGDRQYYFCFLEEAMVVVAENGARTYGIEGERTIVIQMPGDAWILTVLDLSADTLILEGVFGASDEFQRRSGIPGLQEQFIGLWMDPDNDRYPLEFTPGGTTLGAFGRGTYRVVSDSHVFVDCDDPAACSSYREHGQAEDAPLSLRVYEIAEGRLTVVGLGFVERWTLERLEGHSTLGADIVGLWQDEDGATLQFTDAGDLLRDNDSIGSYEVLSETTLWVTLDDGADEAWVVTELDADSMAYIKMDLYWDEPWGHTRVE